MIRINVTNGQNIMESKKKKRINVTNICFDNCQKNPFPMYTKQQQKSGSLILDKTKQKNKLKFSSDFIIELFFRVFVVVVVCYRLIHTISPSIYVCPLSSRYN